jgi:Skp family chaperone for outer membrane proteins
MNRIATSIVQITVITFCIMSADLLAANADFSSIEAQERAQIISELTFHLNTKQVCTQTPVWDDSGSGADLDGYFFNPTVANNEYMIGGHASQKQRSKYHCVTVVSLPANTPKGAPPLLLSPIEWKQIWKDSGSGATKDGSFWQAISPDNNYKCIGSVSQLGHNQKPNLSSYRCVHKSLAEKITSNNIIWSDKGTGADKQVTIFGLPNTGAFTAVASRSSKTETYDLKKNAASIPDPKMVEEILSKRLGPIKADIEAKTKAIKEKKEAEQKAIAEKEAKQAEQKKLAEAAAKQKQTQAAEQKAIAEKEVQEKQKMLEQEQQAIMAESTINMEEVRKVVAEKQSNVAEPENEPESAQAPIQIQKPVKEGPKPTPMAKEVAKVEFETSKAIDTGSNKSAGTVQKDSKGLNDILMFFVKVFGIMVGGVVIFLIAFKVLFGKNKAQ